MAEQKILSDYLNGMGKAKLKNIKFNDDFTTLALAEADASMVARGTFCQVVGTIYYRQTAGQPLKAVIDEPTLTTTLSTLQTNITNQIAQSKAFTPFDASAGGATLPTGGKNGQGYYVTASGTVAGTLFSANDVFFAKQDNPTLISHFGDIVPIASLATAGVAGVVKIATTLAEYNTGIADTGLAVSAPVIASLISTINASLTAIINSKELEIAPATVLGSGIVVAMGNYIAAISDKTKIVTTGLFKNLYDYTIAAIAVLTTRVTSLEDKNAKKFSVELTDASGVITETFYTTLQSAVDYADTQTVTNKRIIVRQDSKITTTIKLKSSIVIDFTDHDVYAVSDITLFDDALMASANGGIVELIGIKDLVVAITDTTGSTNAIMKMTGTGTNRRYRIHAENIYTAISILKTATIATTGLATSLDVISENVIDCYSTSGNIVSNYNDKYGSMSAYHSNRLFDVGLATLRIDCVVGKYTRCMGLINNTGLGGTDTTTFLYMECPNVKITTNYVASGSDLYCVFHVKNYLITHGMSLVKATGNGLILNMKNTCVRSVCQNSDVVGNIALYHTTSDALLNTATNAASAIPTIIWVGSCFVFAAHFRYYINATVGNAVETRVFGVLVSNMPVNSTLVGGNVIEDSYAFYNLSDYVARQANVTGSV